MAKYLIQGSYTAEGIKGVLKEGGSGRREAVSAALKGLGGKIEAMYYAFGDTDVYVIIEAPDNVTAAALAMGVSATGTVGIKTTVLLSVEEVDQATKKTLSYRPAGH
ncbi:MAG: GYD domain-containing protein [Candidatus Dormibacteraeota bacterium]|nr:GYD domain-containing protein [Candidatus Dormibacteraeota bacterium]